MFKFNTLLTTSLTVVLASHIATANDFNDMAPDIKRAIAQYLPPQGILALSSTSKTNFYTLAQERTEIVVNAGFRPLQLQGKLAAELAKEIQNKYKKEDSNLSDFIKEYHEMFQSEKFIDAAIDELFKTSTPRNKSRSRTPSPSRTTDNKQAPVLTSSVKRTPFVLALKKLDSTQAKELVNGIMESEGKTSMENIFNYIKMSKMLDVGYIEKLTGEMGKPIMMDNSYYHIQGTINQDDIKSFSPQEIIDELKKTDVKYRAGMIEIIHFLHKDATNLPWSSYKRWFENLTKIGDNLDNFHGVMMAIKNNYYPYKSLEGFKEFYNINLNCLIGALNNKKYDKDKVIKNLANMRGIIESDKRPSFAKLNFEKMLLEDAKKPNFFTEATSKIKNFFK